MPKPVGNAQWMFGYKSVQTLIEQQFITLPGGVQDGTKPVNPDGFLWAADDAFGASMNGSLDKGQKVVLSMPLILDNFVHFLTVSVGMGNNKKGVLRFYCPGWQTQPIYTLSFKTAGKFALLTPALGYSLDPVTGEYYFSDPRVVQIPNSQGGQGVPCEAYVELEAIDASHSAGGQSNFQQVGGGNEWFDAWAGGHTMTDLGNGFTLVGP